MVNCPGPLDRVFSALADPTRRGMLERLSRGECTVTELAEPYDVSLPAISRHLKVLEKSGLVGRTVDGRVHRCRLLVDGLDDATDWIERHRGFWEEQLQSLADYLDQKQREVGPRKKEKRK